MSNNKLSDDFNEYIANNYPHLEEKVKNAFGVQPSKPTNEMKQVSLDSKATVDNNLNKLVDIINNPDTLPENKVKALSAYKMIFDKMNSRTTSNKAEKDPSELAPSSDNSKEDALKRMTSPQINNKPISKPTPSKSSKPLENEGETPEQEKEFEIAAR